MDRRRSIPLLLVLGALLLPSLAVAQIEANLSKYTGPNAEGYLTPLKDGIGAALQSGQNRSAALPQGKWQFNLDLKTAFVKFADGDRTFQAKTEEGFLPATNVEVPTVIGDVEAVTVPGQGGTVAVFPGGLDVGSLGLAVPQLTIGVPIGSQLLVRYIAVETGDAEIGELSLLGLGARHSISQYVASMPFDLAAGFLWQKFELGTDLIDATALSFGVQASRQYSVLEPYLGLSLDAFEMSVDYEYGNETPPDKLSVDFDRSSDVHFLGGLGLNLKFFHLYGEVGHSSQTSYALGLSLGN